MNEAMQALAVSIDQCTEAMQDISKEIDRLRQDTQMRLLAVLRRVGTPVERPKMLARIRQYWNRACQFHIDKAQAALDVVQTRWNEAVAFYGDKWEGSLEGEATKLQIEAKHLRIAVWTALQI